jgi:hypothetical protein
MLARPTGPERSPSPVPTSAMWPHAWSSEDGRVGSTPPGPRPALGSAPTSRMWSSATLPPSRAHGAWRTPGPPRSALQPPPASRLRGAGLLVEDQPAWSPTLRSRTVALQTPSRHLAGPSPAAALARRGSLTGAPTASGSSPSPSSGREPLADGSRPRTGIRGRLGPGLCGPRWSPRTPAPPQGSELTPVSRSVGR